MGCAGGEVDIVEVRSEVAEVKEGAMQFVGAMEATGDFGKVFEEGG